MFYLVIFFIVSTIKAVHATIIALNIDNALKITCKSLLLFPSKSAMIADDMVVNIKIITPIPKYFNIKSSFI